MTQHTLKNLGREKLSLIKRKPIKIGADDLIETSHFHPEKTFPLVVQSTLEGLNLLTWAKTYREFKAYTRTWPLKIAFFCRKAAPERGATRITDSRKILKRLSPQIIARFEEKKIMYVRNYGEGLDLNLAQFYLNPGHLK